MAQDVRFGGQPEELKQEVAVRFLPAALASLSDCIERPNAERGFGFIGGHFHRKWADDNLSKKSSPMDCRGWPRCRYLRTVLPR